MVQQDVETIETLNEEVQQLEWVRTDRLGAQDRRQSGGKKYPHVGVCVFWAYEVCDLPNFFNFVAFGPSSSESFKRSSRLSSSS
jgi:hypothetical protein